MSKISLVRNWGRYPIVEARFHNFRTKDELKKFLNTTSTCIARGSGLSYGDASLAPVILSTLHFNKVLSFDRNAGVLRCESGVTLGDILKIIVPAGWFLPVTPGTKFITLGGAVATDIHGKNHHKEGSFTQYISEMTLMIHTGEEITCSRTENADLFHSTCGGMGLSGVILEIEFQLKKIETAYISQRNIIAENLKDLVAKLQEFNEATYSVAWVDCMSTGKKMGRGVLMLGEHAGMDDLSNGSAKKPLKIHGDPRIKVPFDMPSILLNRYSIGAFNELFYWKHRMMKKENTVHYDSFFYPLDHIRDWNRLYGRRGFIQYQFVIPFADGERNLHRILKHISRSKLGSFLSVLKLLGKSEHPIAFAMPGFTLALDFPVSVKLFELLDETDKIVADHGGRLYLAKDARMKLDTFAKGYPNADKFRDILKRDTDAMKFESLLSRRLAIVK